MAQFKLIFSLFFIMLSHSLLAGEALELLNQYRQAVGLTELQQSNELQQSAQAHADYLVQYDRGQIKTLQDAHNEQADSIGFTGETVGDRTKATNYAHRSVSENISLGNSDENSSIRLLMSGIYHRFGFLNFLIDEIGIGITDKVYVYNMGRSDLASVCQDPPTQALASAPHDCLGTRVTQPFWNKLCASIRSQDIFAPPYKHRCGNGTLLKASYMQAICQSPPAAATLTGSGAYYKICGNATKIKASWLDGLCRNPPKKAKYRGDGRYYKICESPKKVPAYWLKKRCNAASEADKYTDSGRYTLSCNTQPHKIKIEYTQQLDQQRYEASPRYIAWPAPDMQQVDVAFYTEIPDPLPDLEESGYPLSLQFNSAKVQQVKILNVDIAYQDGSRWLAVKNIRQLTALNDPNKKLTPLEFAWFPLQKLRWGTVYRITVEAKIDNQVEQIQWQFTTKSFLSFLS